MRAGIVVNVARGNDRTYGHVFTSRVRAMGIRDRPISPQSPWQNGYAERLIGILRRECLDQTIIFGETQLRRILEARTHLALQKDAPVHRVRSGGVVAIPVLAGLHHQYIQIYRRYPKPGCDERYFLSPSARSPGDNPGLEER